MTTAVPILRVADVDQALPWWRRLGFIEVFRHQFEARLPRFVGIRRDDCLIYLSEHPGDASGPSLIYLWIADIDEVAAEFGATVTEMPWARDCEITDPDGNRIRAASATQP
jgi:catechol 2,3-dioxygenase-like lactoylglutathione lyase family enzyme